MGQRKEAFKLQGKEAFKLKRSHEWKLAPRLSLGCYSPPPPPPPHPSLAWALSHPCSKQKELDNIHLNQIESPVVELGELIRRGSNTCSSHIYMEFLSTLKAHINRVPKNPTRPKFLINSVTCMLNENTPSNPL